MIEAEARGAWKELERKLRPYIARRVASPADVDDLLQDILLKLHRGSAELAEQESFGGWVYRIAHNAIVDRVRSQQRGPVSIGDSADIGDAEGAETDRLRSDLGQCVALFVTRLSSPYREAITLTELQGLTHRQAAEMLGVSLPAVKSQVLRGRRKIREMFDECCRISLDCRGRVVECEAREPAEVPSACRSTAVAWAKPRD